MNLKKLFCFVALLSTVCTTSIAKADDHETDDQENSITKSDDRKTDDQEHLNQATTMSIQKKCFQTNRRQIANLYRQVRSNCKNRLKNSAACLQSKTELEIAKADAKTKIETCTASNGSAPTAPVTAPVIVPVLANCQFQGKTIASGQSVMAYQSASVASGSTCGSQSRLCTNGTLSGAYTFGSCTVAQAPAPIPVPVPVLASCQFQGKTIASGQSVTAYQSASVASGSTCGSQSRLCTNGTLSGAYTFGSCIVAQAPAPIPVPVPVLASCQFQGKTIASGQSTTAYQAASVPFGVMCSSQPRVCNNGTLSGAYTFAACTTTAAPALDGAAIYTQNCAGCHGPVGSSAVMGRSAAQISTAFLNISSHKSRANIMALTPAEISAMARALGGTP